MFACEGGSTAVAPQTIHHTCQEQKTCSVVDQTKGRQLMLHIRMYVVCHFSRVIKIEIRADYCSQNIISHTTLTYNSHIQLSHTTLTYNSHIQLSHTTLTYNSHMQLANRS